MTAGNDCGTVLLLEDEELVSTVASQILAFLNYDVVIAREGGEAVELYRDRFEAGDSFTAVIMDLSIPDGMGGQQAVKEVLKIDPDARVIVSSGHTLDPVMMDYRKHGFCAAINKPFSVPELTRLMQEIIR